MAKRQAYLGAYVIWPADTPVDSIAEVGDLILLLTEGPEDLLLLDPQPVCDSRITVIPDP
jgi:hypothetical protein